MFQAIITSFMYAFLFGATVHLLAPIVGFDSQETNLLYLFSAVIIFAGIIAPALEESIEEHNQRANERIQKEHDELARQEEGLDDKEADPK